jgi:hypothetical protein
MKDWQKVVLVALVFAAFWFLFVKKSGYSLCNLAEYASEMTGTLAPPGMVADMGMSTAPMAMQTVSSAMVDTMAMGTSGYMKKGCGCNK